jgi:predicted RNase H-like nuclease
MIFPKIREVDGILKNDLALRSRVFEIHPEVAFWRFNGEKALCKPKKVRGRPHPPGVALRRDLLTSEGLPNSLIRASTPRGAGEDDVVDALACAAVARRLHAGLARPFPNPPPRDAHDLPMAIWA